MERSEKVQREERGWRELAVDIAVGAGLAAIVVLVVAALSGAAPTFVYQMF